MASEQQAMLEARKLELARKISIAYYELGFVAINLDINERLTDMVSQLRQVAKPNMPLVKASSRTCSRPRWN